MSFTFRTVVIFVPYHFVVAMVIFLIVASRMRGMVASVPFEQFHKYSTDIVRTAVFGKDKEGKLKSVLKFPANNLVSVLPPVCSKMYCSNAM